jgi:hypothetical protein
VLDKHACAEAKDGRSDEIEVFVIKKMEAARSQKPIQ